MYIGLHVKYQIFFSDFNETWIFTTDFLKILNFTKIRLVGVELFHADMQMDGQTNISKLVVAFRYFAKVPKTPSTQLYIYYLVHSYKDISFFSSHRNLC